MGPDRAVYRPEGKFSHSLCGCAAARDARPDRPAPQGQDDENTALFDVVLVAFGGRDDIGAAEPAMQVDVAAARRAERADGLGRGPVADRAAADGLGGFRSGGAPVGRFV